MKTAEKYLEDMGFVYNEQYGVQYLAKEVVIGVMKNYAMHRESEKRKQDVLDRF